MSSDGGSFSHQSMHVGSDWYVQCCAYADSTPILSVDAGSSGVSFSVADRNPTDAAVEFARDLARKAGDFAAEVERLHAARLADSGSTDGGSPATGPAADCGPSVATSKAA